MDRRLSLEIGTKTDTVSGLQPAAHPTCYFLLSYITVLKSAPNGPSLLGYKSVYSYHSFLEFKVSDLSF